MIDLMVKNIFENSTKIDLIAKHISKTNKKIGLNLLALAVVSYIMAKTIDKHEEKINNLENELKEMKSKGE